MPLFSYSAANARGEVIRGDVSADDESAAMKALSEQDLVVTRLRRRKERNLVLWGGERLKSEDLLSFTQQLASLLNAAMPLPKALEIIGKDSQDPLLKRIANDLTKGVRQGEALSEGLAKYPRVFSKLFLSMTRSGESAGNLPRVLSRLVSYIQEAEALRGRVIGAIAYPAVILVFSLVLVVLIFVFAVPCFKEIYDGMGKALPPLTTLFLNLGDLLSHNLLPLSCLLAAGAGGLWWLLRFEATWYQIDSIVLRLPLVGPLVQRVALTRFSRTLSTLLEAGVPIIKTLELVAGATGNRVLERSLLQAAQDVSEGKSLADSLRNCTVFTQMALSMVASGEEAGALPPILDKLAEFYEQQVEQSLKALTGILEPVIMMGVGSIVAVIILVLGLPLFNLATTLGG